MNLFNALMNTYIKLNKRQIKDFEKKHPTRAEQDRYLGKLKDSDDYYRIAYNKYKCVCFYHYSLFIRLFYNFASLFLLLPMFIYFNRRHLRPPEQNKSKIVVRKFSVLGYDDIFPEELRRDHIVTDIITSDSGVFLDREANSIIRNAFLRHPFSFYFILILMSRLARQSTVINRENPGIVCVYACEREFADPLLTLYSEKKGVAYYGFMHGDFMYQIDHAFMKYTSYWVWDEHYIKMFTELRCRQSMVVYLPKKYKPLSIKIKNEQECEYYMCYYFSGESKRSIDELVKVYDLLREKGKKCKIRPHPRFSNIEYIREAFAEYDIEDTGTISLEQSLENSYLIAALNSTVLSEALHTGKTVVIDDVSDKRGYQELRDKEYILYSKANYRLSEILGMNGVTI